MILGIIGSRNIGTMSVEKMIEYIPNDCQKVISGGAVGIDTLAEDVASHLQLEFLKIVPNYDFFGKTAPLVRNTKIVELSDKVLAFWDYQSRGTAHAIRECIRLNVPIEIISIK